MTVSQLAARLCLLALDGHGAEDVEIEYELSGEAYYKDPVEIIKDTYMNKNVVVIK